MRSLSVVVPTLEEPDLRPLLDALVRVLSPLASELEIVLVDDSGAAAHDALTSLAGAFTGANVRPIAGPRAGKGAAVRLGLQQAAGDVIIFLDADSGLEHIELLPRFVEAIAGGDADVVIGERRENWQYRNFLRFVLSIGLFAAQRVFIFHSTRFFDTQCGLKAFRADVGRRLAALQTVDGGMFDIEYLYAAVKNRLKIVQIPVPLARERRESRIRVLRCMVTDPAALVRVKLNGLAGHYRFEKRR
jgi:glycosyltransferase involved in cell wall biosynthesis